MVKSETYWTNRANKRMVTYHRDSDEVICLLSKTYDEAIKEISKDIETIFGNFAKGNKLTQKEAKKFLNSKIPTPIMKWIERKLPLVKSEKIRKWIISHIEAQAYGARITRLEALKESIYLNLVTVADVEIRESEKLYTKTINKAYYLNSYDIQKGLGIGFNLAAMPTDVIEEILKTKWSGKHYSDRVWSNSNVLAELLEETVLKGIMTGMSYKKLAKDLEEYSNIGLFAAERLIRTEMTYVSNQAELRSYQECGIEKYIFIATLDNKTSETCQEMDRKVVEIKNAIAGKNLPPLHPWCRSTTGAYLDDSVLKDSQRRARDSETGKTYLVPADMSYSEWKENFVVKNSHSIKI